MIKLYYFCPFKNELNGIILFICLLQLIDILIFGCDGFIDRNNLMLYVERNNDQTKHVNCTIYLLTECLYLTLIAMIINLTETYINFNSAFDHKYILYIFIIYI